jgi:hypothetical protein
MRAGVLLKVMKQKGSRLLFSLRSKKGNNERREQ